MAETRVKTQNFVFVLCFIVCRYRFLKTHVLYHLFYVVFDQELVMVIVQYWFLQENKI